VLALALEERLGAVQLTAQEHQSAKVVVGGAAAAGCAERLHLLERLGERRQRIFAPARLEKREPSVAQDEGVDVAPFEPLGGSERLVETAQRLLEAATLPQRHADIVGDHREAFAVAGDEEQIAGLLVMPERLARVAELGREVAEQVVQRRTLGCVFRHIRGGGPDSLHGDVHAPRQVALPLLEDCSEHGDADLIERGLGIVRQAIGDGAGRIEGR
jgi:hypothetical protein